MPLRAASWTWTPLKARSPRRLTPARESGVRASIPGFRKRPPVRAEKVLTEYVHNPDNLPGADLSKERPSNWVWVMNTAELNETETLTAEFDKQPFDGDGPV